MRVRHEALGTLVGYRLMGQKAVLPNGRFGADRFPLMACFVVAVAKLRPKHSWTGRELAGSVLRPGSGGVARWRQIDERTRLDS